jgi:predicted aldo/keto reductase-like oxidoreductase
VKCLACSTPMIGLVNDFDYTTLANLRGTAVILVDVTIFQCAYCGPPANYVEIPRMAELHRNLAATKTLHAKRLHFRFIGGEWAVVIPLTKQHAAKKGKP